MSESSQGQLFFRGTPVEIFIEPSRFSFGKVELNREQLKVRLPATVASSNSLAYCSQQIEGWLKAQARTTLNLEVFNLGRMFGFSYKNVAIKDTRSRWGSCSGKTNLNFNWRLIMAPPEVLRYVVVHETAHLQEMNHSNRFWIIVQSRCPDFRKHQDWLKRNGAKILDWRLQF